MDCVDMPTPLPLTDEEFLAILSALHDQVSADERWAATCAAGNVQTGAGERAARTRALIESLYKRRAAAAYAEA